jgi:hypothetical protein
VFGLHITIPRTSSLGDQIILQVLSSITTSIMAATTITDVEITGSVTAVYTASASDVSPTIVEPGVYNNGHIILPHQAVLYVELQYPPNQPSVNIAELANLPKYAQTGSGPVSAWAPSPASAASVDSSVTYFFPYGAPAVHDTSAVSGASTVTWHYDTIIASVRGLARLPADPPGSISTSLTSTNSTDTTPTNTSPTSKSLTSTASTGTASTSTASTSTASTGTPTTTDLATTSSASITSAASVAAAASLGHTTLGAAVGGSVGGLVVGIAAAVIAFACLRHRRPRNSGEYV